MKRFHNSKLLLAAILFFSLIVSIASSKKILAGPENNPLAFLESVNIDWESISKTIIKQEQLDAGEGFKLAEAINKEYQKYFREQVNRETSDTSNGHQVNKLELEKKVKEREKRFHDWYLAHFFFDRKEFIVDKLKDGNDFFHPPTRYQKNGENPFEGYLAAENYLQGKLAQDLGVDDILEIHRRLISKKFLSDTDCDGNKKRNSENMDDKDIGTIRDLNTGETLASLELNAWKNRRIFNGEQFNNSPKIFNDLEKINPLLMLKTRAVDEMEEDRIWYTPLSHYRLYQEDLRPETYKKLVAEENKLAKKSLNLDYEGSTVLNKLRKKVINELIDSALKKLKQQMVVALKNNQQDQIIEAAGNFYHRFLSIHPFINGNGRVGRAIIKKVLEENNIAPPIFTHWGEDIFLTENEFNLILKDSVKLSEIFHQNLLELSKRQIDYHAIATPYLTPEVLQEFSKEEQEQIIPEEFMTWVRFQGKLQVNNTQEAINKYLSWKKDHTYKNDPQKGGTRLATPSFIASFNNSNYDQDTELSRNKRRRFYYEDQETYRGFPLFLNKNEQSLPDDNFLLNYFCNLQPQLAGMSLEDRVYLSEEFNNFNRQLIRNLPQMIATYSGHVRGGGGHNQLYQNSKLSSWSLSLDNAANFANGYCHPDGNKRTHGAIISSKKRKFASLDGTHSSELFPSLSMEHELEILPAIQTDPSSINSVTILHQNASFNGPLKSAKSFKIANRSGDNGNQIGIWQFDSDGKLIAYSEYEFNPKTKKFDLFAEENYDRNNRLSPSFDLLINSPTFPNTNYFNLFPYFIYYDIAKIQETISDLHSKQKSNEIIPYQMKNLDMLISKSLYEAVMSENLPVIEAFSKLKNYDFNKLSFINGNSLLGLAITSGSIEIVEKILNYPNIDWKKKNSEGQTLLALIVMQKNLCEKYPKVLNLLFDKFIEQTDHAKISDIKELSAIDISMEDGNSLSRLAIQYKNFKAYQLIKKKIEEGGKSIDVFNEILSIKTSSGLIKYSLFKFAVMNPNEQILKSMIPKIDADGSFKSLLNKKDKEGKTILANLINHSGFDFANEAIEMLLEKGASIGSPNDVSVFQLLKYSKSKSLLKHLLSFKKFDREKGYDFYGSTPLVIAIESQNLDAIELLLDEHVNVNNTKRNGGNAISTFISWIRNFSLQDQIKVINKLLSVPGVNIDNIPKDLVGHETPLFRALKENSIPKEVVIALLKYQPKGANINIKNTNGETPLKYLEQKFQYLTKEGDISKNGPELVKIKEILEVMRGLN